MEKFIARAKTVYGDHYSYEAVEWKDNKTHIAIMCPDHGAFHITPDNFLYNAGCPSCRGVHPRGYPYGAMRSPKVGRPVETYILYVYRGLGHYVADWENSSELPVLYFREFRGRRTKRAIDQLLGVFFAGEIDDPAALIAMLKNIPE